MVNTSKSVLKHLCDKMSRGRLTVARDTNQIIEIANEIEGGRKAVTWNLKDGQSKRAKVLYILSDNSILIEERVFFYSKIDLISIEEIDSVVHRK